GRGKLRGARIAATVLPPPVPGPVSVQRKVPRDGSSWSPGSGCAPALATPVQRSSPSTSRTPTSALPATVPRSPCTLAPSSVGPSRGGKPRSTPETVNDVVSRNCQASPEPTHHTTISPWKTSSSATSTQGAAASSRSQPGTHAPAIDDQGR